MNNMIEQTFYCFQPIEIKTEVFTNLLQSKISINFTKKHKGNFLPKWLDNFNMFNNVFNSIINIKIDSNIPSDILKDNLFEDFKVNGKLSLSNNLNLDKTNFYLLFDFKAMYFILAYELNFKFDLDKDKYFFNLYENNQDLYNTIRKMLVKEDNNSLLTKWANKIQTTTISKIYTVLKDEININLDKKDIVIQNNTGNITNIVDLSKSNLKNKELFIQKIIELNNHAERLKNSKTPIILDDSEKIKYSDLYSYNLYHFNGRFHTIILNEVADLYRYIPIQFHMQYMWFYLKQINIVLEEQYNQIMDNDSFKNISFYTNTIDNLINKIELLVIHNEKFKLALEIDNEKIYSKIQVNWNIENMLLSSNRYINYFKDYLSRIYNKKTSIREQKQNKILLFISIFQFVALISVWTDYLSIIDKETTLKADKIIDLFGSNSNFEIFNLYLPIFFGIIIISMIFYIYKHKE